MLSWVVWVVFKKTTDVLFIKDNEDNLGQLVYQELENWRIYTLFIYNVNSLIL